MPATTYSQLGSGTGLIHICDSGGTVIRSVPNITQTVNYITGYNLWKKTTRVYLDCNGSPVPGTVQGGANPALEITELIQIDRLASLSGDNGYSVTQISLPVKFDGAARTYIPVFKYSGEILAIECFVTTTIDVANDGEVDVQINGVSCLTGGTPINIPMGSVASPVGFSVNGSIDTGANTFSVGDNMQIVTDNATSGEALLIITTRVTS